MLFFDLYFYCQMPETIQQNNPNIYLAPLQGFTDLVYRRAYSEIFRGIDTFFIPYITVKNNQILKKCEFKDDLLSGYCLYYDNGEIAKAERYNMGVKEGEWTDMKSFKRDHKQ